MVKIVGIYLLTGQFKVACNAVSLIAFAFVHCTRTVSLPARLHVQLEDPEDHHADCRLPRHCRT